MVSSAAAYHDQLRARGKTHHQALRQLANRWAAILHACIHRGQLYHETPPGSTGTPLLLDTFRPWGV